MAKITYQMIKRCRIKRYGFLVVQNFGGYFWSNEHRRWIHWEQSMGGKGSSNCFPGKCRSIRAFRRRLREWSRYLPPGIRFRLVHHWIGHDVYGWSSVSA